MAKTGSILTILLLSFVLPACNQEQPKNAQQQKGAQPQETGVKATLKEHVVKPVQDQYDRSVRPLIDDSKAIQSSLREAREQADALAEVTRDAKDMAVSAKKNAIAAKSMAVGAKNGAVSYASSARDAVVGTVQQIPQWEHDFQEGLRGYVKGWNEWLRELFRRRRAQSARASLGSSSSSSGKKKVDRLHGGGRR